VSLQVNLRIKQHQFSYTPLSGVFSVVPEYLGSRSIDDIPFECIAFSRSRVICTTVLRRGEDMIILRLIAMSLTGHIKIIPMHTSA
jgi:hypothetical protein